MTALKNTLVYHHKEAFREKRLVPVTRDGKQHLRAHDSGNFPSRWQVHIGPCYRSATATYRYWSPEEEWLPSPMTGPGNTQFANFEDWWEDLWSGRRNEKATLEHSRGAAWSCQKSDKGTRTRSHLIRQPTLICSFITKRATRYPKVVSGFSSTSPSSTPLLPLVLGWAASHTWYLKYLRGRYSLKVIQIFALSSTHPEEEVEAMYEDISRAINTTKIYFKGDLMVSWEWGNLGMGNGTPGDRGWEGGGIPGEG